MRTFEKGINRELAMRMVRFLNVAVLAVVLVGVQMARADPIIDQQQMIIDTSGGFNFAIGGNSEQMLAQVVTAGITGQLTEVRFPVVGGSGNLIVEIQAVSGSIPNGIVLTSQTTPAASFPPFGSSSPSFRSIVFSTSVGFAAGDLFAIVLKSDGSFGISPGPLGNPYQGGDAFLIPGPTNRVCG